MFDNYETITIPDVGTFESYPNRNSKQYIDLYGIKKTQTMIRGTYRYQGWCPTMKKIADIGYLDLNPTSFDRKSYAELTASRINSTSTGNVPYFWHNKIDNLAKQVADFLKLSEDDYRIKNMDWLGLFDKTKKVGPKINTFLDALCEICKEK